MEKNSLVAPVVKWAGGKRQLLDQIIPLVPRRYECYCEPFLGGGALFFALQPPIAFINDLNTDLMCVYKVIKDSPEELIASLEKHENVSDYFYKIRDMDRDKKRFRNLSKIEKASRLLYLNKTCYNGLFRVNAAGEFNAPFGRYRNPTIVNAPTIRAVSEYFNANDIQFFNLDFADVLRMANKNWFVYLDPPYDPVSDTASFTGYNKGKFDREEQLRLKECCDRLREQGICFLLSNSATDFIKDIYKGYYFKIVQAKRAINSDASKRSAIEEVLISGTKRSGMAKII